MGSTSTSYAAGGIAAAAVERSPVDPGLPEWVSGSPLWEDGSEDYHSTVWSLGISPDLGSALFDRNERWLSRQEDEPLDVVRLLAGDQSAAAHLVAMIEAREAVARLAGRAKNCTMESVAGTETFPLDELLVTVVVDNATDTLSSVADGIPQLPEMVHLLGGPAMGSYDGRDMIAVFAQLCIACHGFSVLATGRRGDDVSTVLFDVGPSGEVWLTNADRLGIDLSDISVLFVSHWHGDHTGGIPTVVRAIAAARSHAGRPPLLVDVHPDRPDRRGFLTPFGAFAMLPDEPTFAAIEAAGGQIVRHADVHSVSGGVFLSSGDIPRRTAYETGLGVHFTWRDGKAAADPEIHDERFLAARVRGRGTTVLSSCSHAGIVNVALEAQRLFPEQPIDLLLGGYHLAGSAVEDRIDATVADLADVIAPRIVAPGHCTGWRAASALATALGPKSFASCVVGTRFVLTSP